MTDPDDIAAMQDEANAFAMELLMPTAWVRRDAAKIDLTDDAAIEKLAKRYRVPTATMAIRIGEVRAALEPVGNQKRSD